MRLLVATDGSPEALSACRFVQLLPLPPGSTIHVVSAVHVQPPYPAHHASWRTMEVLFEYQRQGAQRAVRQAAEMLSREGVTVTTSIPGGEPAPRILQTAEEMHADLVVVGSRGLTGLAGLLLGSVARSVAKGCRRSVLVAREPRNQLQEVLVATDGSEHASRAVELAGTLPLSEGTRITLVHVARPYRPSPGLLPREREAFQAAAEEARVRQEEHATELLNAAKERLAAAGRQAQTEARFGDPAAEILSVAEERQADLILCGPRGVSLIEGLLMGSVADRLVKHAPCSVLIAR